LDGGEVAGFACLEYIHGGGGMMVSTIVTHFLGFMPKA
jgi:hypothetical protein